MVRRPWKLTLHQACQHLDIVAIMLLLILYFLLFHTTLRTVLGWLFLFVPGYSVTRLTVLRWKRSFVHGLTGVIVFSLCIDPLLGNMVQLLTSLTPWSVLSGLLAFSLPVLLGSKFKARSDPQENFGSSEDVEVRGGLKDFLLGKAAFFFSLIIGFGLYVQVSLGAVAPRGYDIYGHMRRVNGIIESGSAPFFPDLNVLSNFYHLFYSEICLLTGLDVLDASLIAQVLVGVILAMTVYYFAEHVTSSSIASFIGVVLFLVGPPLFGGITRYFYYFHPMWVAFAMFPFALAYAHRCISEPEERHICLASVIVAALFLYHLVIGLILSFILLVDSLLLLRSKWRLLLPRLAKIATLTFLISAFMVLPFVFNLSNPFKYVYPTGGFETLHSMFFGVSRYAYVFRGGWEFFARYLQEFANTVVPLVVLGFPALVFLFLKRRRSFVLIFACVVTGLLGALQPYLGIAFLPQRFTQPMIVFGATLAGFSISRVLRIPTIVFEEQGETKRIRLVFSKTVKNTSTLLLVLLCSSLLCAYLILYSPAKQAVLEAELYIDEDDLKVIEWIDKNIPENSTILMDQYLQFFLTGITGRTPLYSITTGKPLYEIWDVYPVDVYLGQTNPLEVNAEYIVVSRWCYTTWDFVGKSYFDQHTNLTRIFERGYYAVYELVR